MLLVLHALETLNSPALPARLPHACAGIAIRAGPGCAAEACVLQGNLIRGRAISGCGAAASLTAAIGWFGGSPAPAWDANQVRCHQWVPRELYACLRGVQNMLLCTQSCCPPPPLHTERQHPVLQPPCPPCMHTSPSAPARLLPTVQFDIGSIAPCATTKRYSMWHAAPGTATAREVLK